MKKEYFVDPNTKFQIRKGCPKISTQQERYRF